MKRRIFNVLTVLSLALGLATILMWVISYAGAYEQGFSAVEDARGLYSLRYIDLASWRGLAGIGTVNHSEPVTAATDRRIATLQTQASRGMVRLDFFQPREPMARLSGCSW